MTPEILLVLSIIALFIELFYRPRFGWTRERDVLLFLTVQKSRVYIKLFKI